MELRICPTGVIVIFVRAERGVAGAVKSEFYVSPQTENIIRAVCSWIYLIDALDDYDKDSQRKRFNPLVVNGLMFDEYVNGYWQDIYRYFDETVGRYKYLAEKGFDYYTANIIINEFIPDVCENILTRKKMKKPLIARNEVVFEDAAEPYTGISVYVDIPADAKKLDEFINELHDKFKCGVRLIFSHNAKKFLKKLPAATVNKLTVAIETEQNEGIEQLKQILFGHSNDCRYNSCFGRIFYINSSNRIFACKEGHLSIDSLSGMSENPEIAEILEKAIKHRGHCKETCEVYSLCNGGCPIKNDCIGAEEFKKRKSRIEERLNPKNLTDLRQDERKVFIKWITHCRGRLK
ncbi:MAG: DUF5685 family protein [Alphaproteobacteria bacterium]|nr:DUF5685 family protein [Alphaproteobacteria bacterium]MCL2505837.1 DUF5685 family protein [Alphaproteobacteria bacterium]